MENTHIYEPLSEYKHTYKNKHNENTEKLFNELVLKSEVNIKENEETIKLIKKLTNALKDVTKKISNYKLLRIFMVLATIGLSIYSIYTLYVITLSEQLVLDIVLSVSFLIVSGLFIFLIIKKISPLIKHLTENKNDLSKKIDEETELSFKQMKPLNDLFTEDMSIDLFKKTIPIINLDNVFNYKRYDYLISKFGLSKEIDMDRSTLIVKSGDINGNPFYIANDLVHQLGTKTYTGSITITYTTYTTINGKRTAQTRTQVLTASVDKPFPYYNKQSYLVYGNEVAPNLNFSRTDSDAENMSQKQIDRHVTRTIKKLDKKASKSIKKGGNYTVLGHSEFEVLFGATNRDNEVQFRLLFTPLAQKQLLELMKDQEIGYGDNFDFVKRNMINIIYPEHLKMFEFDGNPKHYYSNDFNKIKKQFIDYNNNFFKAIYFAFAPVLSIPLYQQHKPHEYIYKDLYPSYVSFYEHEAVANKLDINKFKHELSATNNILKTKVVKSHDHKDEIVVTAYGYQEVPRIDYKTRMGADGKMHTIPIHWNEYIPVSKETLLNIDTPKEEKVETYQERFRKYFESLAKDRNISERDIYRIGRFLVTFIDK